ncbi:MAG: excinuclease ABC subunit UvrA [Clostridia bacterium]|nr:excinuclease ABC subunit UvrA [Clostridia bacterium]
METDIFVKGAKEHNLKNLDVTIPRDKLTVFTGLSGSGKSSLAFDTIFAEGQRRYVESLSAYARMFIGQMEKPDVEFITGLSPAISIDQKTTSNNPRSTVGTITEIYDYLRLMYANIGKPHCPKCGKPIEENSIDQICDSIMENMGAAVIIKAPVVRRRKGEFGKLFEDYRKQGFLRIVIDDIQFMLDEELPKLDKNLKHDVSLVVDRLKIKAGIERRLTDSLETALKIADGLVIAEINGEDKLFNTHYSCPDCDVSIPELSPRLFSFNSPIGACPHCNGLGFREEVDIKTLIPDMSKSLAEGAIDIKGLSFDAKMTRAQITAVADKYSFDINTPLDKLPPFALNVLLYGNGTEKVKVNYVSNSFQGTMNTNFEGIIPTIERRYNNTESEMMKREYRRYMRLVSCKRCEGKRLKPEALAVTVGGKNINEFTAMSISQALRFVDGLVLTPREQKITKMILKEIKARLNFLVNVGLDYLTLSREASTLSGGEAQRIRLATQIGSGLVGVLYILDEPSIGLHQRDNNRLISTLKNLRDLGNTLIVVEHDEDTIRSADYIVDIGPGAGVNGGELVVAGSIDDVMNEPRSVTGDFLAGRRKIEIPAERRSSGGRFLKVFGASQNNLKSIDVSFPVGCFTAVTGVSGSGKSSLINGILKPYLSTYLNKAQNEKLGKCDRIEGLEYFDKVICIDQSPIGRTPRSNPATYTGVFTDIRALFAMTPDANARGYREGRFSFNVAGGRCESCSGDGIKKIEMHFLPDVYVQCDVCHGKRYNRETLEVRYKGKNISEVLEMSIQEACVFFENQPRIYNKIKTLYDVGLGYVKLGQSATTLSGGEAQRVKLATELSKRSTGKTVYVLDEPTTGLHSADVEKLLSMLDKLVASGNTVIVIEHNLDVIKVADHIIDLGPEGGDKGGTVVTCGTPEEVSDCDASYTGQFLKRMLNNK